MTREEHFGAWGHLVHAIAYLTKEWPFGAENTSEAIGLMDKCIRQIAEDVAERDARGGYEKHT